MKFDAGRYEHGDVSLPRIDAIAARARDGTLWLALTNLDANSSVRVRLMAFGITRARGQTLSAPRVDSVNTFEAPQAVRPTPLTVAGGERRANTHRSGSADGTGAIGLDLAPHSVSVVALE